MIPKKNSVLAIKCKYIAHREKGTRLVMTTKLL